jgi:AraC-like DNA-binding protein
MRKGEARDLSVGDVVVAAPQVGGLFRASQLSNLRLAYFRFCPELAGGMLTMMERRCFDLLAAKPVSAVLVFHGAHPVVVKFKELCARAGSRNGLLIRCDMMELIGLAFDRHLTRASTPEKSTLSASKRIKVLMQHLTEEEFLNSSADQLAAYCGCSLRHFSRLFLHTFKVSLRGCQTDLRLRKARRLLAETDSRVVTVATSCGYRHLGVFNALFKKRFGMTPTEWRRDATGRKDGLPFCEEAGAGGPDHGRDTSGSNGAVVTEK